MLPRVSASAILMLNAALRTAYGVGALLAPDAQAWAARMPTLPADARYFNALFGGRDLTVAAGTAALLRGGHEKAALVVATSCEITDLLAWTQEARRRGDPDQTVLLGAAFNVVGALTCLAAASARRR